MNYRCYLLDNNGNCSEIFVNLQSESLVKNVLGDEFEAKKFRIGNLNYTLYHCVNEEGKNQRTIGDEEYSGSILLSSFNNDDLSDEDIANIRNNILPGLDLLFILNIER